MDIFGYRDSNDNKYYVPAIVRSTQLANAFWINFLLDTGASKTQLSWNDANYYGVIIRSLPPDNSIYSGLGGSVKGYSLYGTTLTFKSNNGRYMRSIDSLSVSDYKTTDGRQCPRVSSVLGIDIVSLFDIYFRGKYVILRNNL